MRRPSEVMMPLLVVVALLVAPSVAQQEGLNAVDSCIHKLDPDFDMTSAFYRFADLIKSDLSTGSD